MPERATMQNRSEKSAEAVVVSLQGRRRAEREGVESGMTMWRAMRQMSASAERSGSRQGEAQSEPVSGEALCPRLEAEDTGPGLLVGSSGQSEHATGNEAGSLQPGHSRNRRSWDRRDGPASGVGVAFSARTTVAWDVPASAGATGNDPEAGWRPA